MPKNKSLKPSAKAIESQSLERENAIMSKLIAWAHEASEESVRKLQEFIDDEEQSDEMRRMAEVALEEADYLKYLPADADEEREYNLCELISKRENHLDDLLLKREKSENWLTQMELDKKVHGQLILRLTDDDPRRKNWGMYVSEDAMFMEQNALRELELDIEYYEAWIEEARKSIISEKYKNLPIDFFNEEVDEAEDDDDEIEGGYCPHCNKDN